ncbi:MAG: class II aldolase/adducin family protein, partial [Pseudomonadota bacterium]
MTADSPTESDGGIRVDLPGAIQYAYDLQAPETVVADALLFGQLAAWRTVFARLDFLGQVPGRYGSASFGNLSVRDPDRKTEFVITASQSGAAPEFDQEQITRIVGCNLERFWVDAIGVAPPSSETLTHAAIFATDPRIDWVFHIRSAEISEAAGRLAIP